MKPHKKINQHLGGFIPLSIFLHTTMIGLLLYGTYCFSSIVAVDGDSSIKAVMVDLSLLAAPEQSLVEDSPLVKDNPIQDESPIDEPEKPIEKEVEVVKEEVFEPDLIIEKQNILPLSPQPKEIVIKEAPEKLKQDKPKPEPKKQPPVQKSSQPLVKQELKTDVIADVATASALSANTQYSATPTPIHRGQPEYPRRALDLQIEGHVVVVYDIDAKGNVDNIRIIESKPNNIFNRTVITAMQRWKYQPIVAKDLTIKIIFNRNRSIQFS